MVLISKEVKRRYEGGLKSKFRLPITHIVLLAQT